MKIKRQIHSEAASVSFHIHDIIPASPVAKEFDLWDDNSKVGTIKLELSFSYGTFGYGYSSQMKEPDLHPSEIVQYSLMPRILAPSMDPENEEKSELINIRPIGHPSFIPLKNKTHFSFGEDIAHLSPFLEKMNYVPERFTVGNAMKVHDAYFNQKDRISRLLFLNNYIQTGRMRDEILLDNKSTKTEEIEEENFENLTTPLRDYLSMGRTSDGNTRTGIIKTAALNNDEDEAESAGTSLFRRLSTWMTGRTTTQKRVYPGQ